MPILHNKAPKANQTDRHKAIKTLKYIFISLTVLLITITLLFQSLKLDVVQRRLAAYVSNELNEAYGIPVNIEKIEIKDLSEITLKNVQVLDLNGTTILGTNEAIAHISPFELLDNKLCINTLIFAAPNISLNKETGDSPLNIQFIIDSISKNQNKENDEMLDLRINQFIVYDGTFRFDIKDKIAQQDKFDPNHISIKEFCCNISLKQFTKENINLNIRSIKGKEQSGLDIRMLRARVETKDGYIYMKNLETVFPGSALQSDSIKIGYSKNNPSSLTLEGVVRSPLLSSTTLSPIIPGIEKKMPDMAIEIIGRIDSISAKGSIELRSLDNNLALNGEYQISTPYNDNRSSDITVHNFSISENHIDNLLSYIYDDHSRISSILGDISLKGDARISRTEVSGKGYLTSGCGNIDIAVELDSAGTYKTKVQGKRIGLSTISGYDKLRSCDIFASASGNIKEKSASINAKIKNLTFNGYRYSPIDLKGKISKSNIVAMASTDDPNIAADINLEYATGSNAKSWATLALHSFRPYNLNLSKEYKGNEFAFNLKCEQKNLGRGNKSTNIKLDNFVQNNGESINKLHNLYITDNDAGNYRTLIINSDFFEASVAGDFDLGGIKRSLYNVIETHLPSLGIRNSKSAVCCRNKFYYKLSIKNTDFLNKLIDIPLSIHEKATIEGNCDDSRDYLTMKGNLNNIHIGKTIVRSIDINSISDANSFYLNATIEKPIVKNKKKFDYTNKENDIKISLNSNISSDTIRNILKWNDSGNKNMLGRLRMDAAIGTDKNGKPDIFAIIHNDSIIHNGNQWYISKGTITGNFDVLALNNINLYNDTQKLSIKGLAGKSDEDTLSIHADRFEVSTLLDMSSFRMLKFQGKVTGDAFLTSALSRPDIDGNFSFDTLRIDQGAVGKGNINIGWDHPRKEIYLNANLYNDKQELTHVQGFFSQPNDTIDLIIDANNLNAAFIEQKLKSFLDNINGTASGLVHLKGSWNRIDLYGALALNTGLRIKSTNTRYWFKGDSIRFSKGEISFDNTDIYDRFGNHGKFTASLKHNNMSKWDCNLYIQSGKLLVYDTQEYGTLPFYGTIIAKTNAHFHNKGKNTKLSADLQTQPGSRFIYNSTETGGVRDNSFITFTDSSKEKHKYSIHETAKNEHKDISSKIRLELMLDITDGFGLKVLTNTKTEDYIDLYGNGKINAVYDDKEGFTMNGRYDLVRGTYKFTIQDIFPKEFSISKGSTIHFQGDPFNASLDLKTKYLIPSASLGDLTTETSMRKTVKVNCLMNITNTLKSPALSFDIELPEGSEEERELLASVANTQEQKNMQFIYLLGIGKFYTFDNNAGGGYTQSSTAMESLISNTLSGQLNNMLGQIIDNGNWDFSGNFSTSERGWNKMEVEGMLEGRLLNNRLLINGNFGYRDNPIANRSFIGDFEVQWLINPKGTVSLKAYSKTNDRYFSKTNLTTQGGGLILRFDFDRFAWWRKNRKKNDEDTSDSSKNE